MSGRTYEDGVKRGLRLAITQLHDQAQSMNDPDPKARNILNGAAFLLGRVAAPIPPPPVQGDGDLREKVAQLFYEAAPFHEPGDCLDGFQVSPGSDLTWRQALERDAEFGSLLLSITAEAFTHADRVMALFPEPSPSLERLKAAARAWAKADWMRNPAKHQQLEDELNLAARAFATEEATPSWGRTET